MVRSHSHTVCSKEYMDAQDALAWTVQRHLALSCVLSSEENWLLALSCDLSDV